MPDEAMNESILAGIGNLIRPLFTPLGFGSQLSSYGWVFVVAAITGLIAKEMVVATLGTMAGLDGDAILEGSASEAEAQAFETMLGTMTPAAMFAYMAFNLFSVPCMAAVGAAMGELNSRRKSAQAILFWIITAYTVSFVIFWLGNFNTYMFPLSIVVAVLLVALVGFIIYRTVRKNKAQKALAANVASNSDSVALAELASTDDGKEKEE